MAPLLEVRRLSKTFPGVRALTEVSLHANAGEVLAIVGENGAGKSTLMKILAGIYQPDGGEILYSGQVASFTSVRAALKAGIVLIHQELNLAEKLSVSANLFLGRETCGPLGWLRQRTMNDEALTLLRRVGLNAAPTASVSCLTIGQRQLVEIARALGQSARILIMDEPTSSLSQREAETLFHVIADLKKSGVTVLYISHRLAEVKTVADRVVVLRDGRNAGELARSNIDHESMVRMMVGREMTQLYPRDRPPPTGIRLEVSQLTFEGGGKAPISFQVRGGEVVGLAGLVGAGRTELAEALFGLRKIFSGNVRLDGQLVRVNDPRSAVTRGILLAPEDRRRFGLILRDSVQRNLSLPNLRQLAHWGFVSRSREKTLADQTIGRLKIRTPSANQIVGLLSGGNQQKVVFGKWLARDPKVLILDEPTRGVDVGARAEIYGFINELACQGVAILMISSDLEEVLGVSDRILVMHQGRIAGELPRDQLSEEAVMRLATGDVSSRDPTSVRG
jgi:ribose transport system ATP-binding protein